MKRVNTEYKPNYKTAADNTNLGPWIAGAMVVYFIIAGIILVNII